MAWYDSVVGPIKKTVLPAVSKYGGQVVGGAVGTVIGGPVGALAGAAAGKEASRAIQGHKVNTRSLKAAALGGVLGPAGSVNAYIASELTKPKKKKPKPKPSPRAAAYTRRRKRPMSIMRQLKRTVNRVPAMVVPSGSEKGDALATAGRLIASIQSADPKLSSYAKAVMNQTAKRARNGDPAAKRAVSFLKAAQSANRSKGRLTGFLVTNSGRVVIGSFLQTG